MDVAALPSNPQQLQAIIIALQERLAAGEQLLRVRDSLSAQISALLAQRDAQLRKHEEELTRQQQELERRQLELESQQQELQRKQAIEEQSALRIEKLEAIIAHLQRRLYGPRSEKIDANQLLLFGESVLPLTTPAEEKLPLEVKVNRPHPHGRRIIPARLPREIIAINVPAEERACGCGEAKVRIGEEVSEQLEFIPARLFVRRFVREKLACPKGCDASITTAEKPAQVVEKGLAGPGLIAHVITSKYADHLPLYRLEGIFQRYGIDLCRSTMCNWMQQAANLCRPLVELMRQRILEGRVIHTDDTTVPVQEKEKTRTGRLWVYLGERGSPYNVYDYSPDRRKEHPADWLSGYGGYLQADAYGGYDDVYRTGKVQEVACWAHARRKFVEARDKSREVCDRAIAYIGRLYEIEREAKELEEDKRLALRQEKSVAVLDELGRWLNEMQMQLLPKNPAAEAVGYALNQWEALRRYTREGFLAIDNNAAERAMRSVAIGRKNWLFAGSDEGGRTAAMLYSLIGSAQRHELNVEYYLRSVLAHLPGTKLSELPHLLPDVWKRELAEEEAAAKAMLAK